MIGIRNIGVYIPEIRENNLDRLQQFDIRKDFIENKIGVRRLSRKNYDETTSDLCVKVFKILEAKETGLNPQSIDCISVCTQNGDYRLPHTSAIVQAKLGIQNECAAFDISLGCSGYPHALSVMKSFMEANDLKYGLLFTCDPYSPILGPDDKNTQLLFGDAATVTLLCDNTEIEIGKAAFSTFGEFHKALIINENDILQMNGRAIFNFAMRQVPKNITKCLETNKLKLNAVDMFIFHQASKYLIDNLVRRMQLDPQKVPFEIRDYGNTVSSSIPIILENHLFSQTAKIILLTGFGVGLSVATIILRISK